MEIVSKSDWLLRQFDDAHGHLFAPLAGCFAIVVGRVLGSSQHAPYVERALTKCHPVYVNAIYAVIPLLKVRRSERLGIF